MTRAVEEEPLAHPFHDWNERITSECYAPMASAPLLDEKGRISEFVNNYSSMSFDFGPTLLRWLERNSPETYESILEADKASAKRFDGHGGGMAQIFNHMIMPLATHEDRRTQTIWGVEDFTKRFGRRPEGIWLPETAVDTGTLEALAEEGMAYTILSPQQALEVRREGSGPWTDVSGGRVDSRRAYTCRLPSGKRIALLFYHGGLSVDLAFGNLLGNGDRFAEKLSSVFTDSDEPQIVTVASDGETYGHHHRGGHLSLARCLSKIDQGGKARVVNLGAFLARAPPSFEVRIAQPTAWSCAHGVERWRSNCGCGSEIRQGYNQEWRAPLRQSLDWLRGMLAAVYTEEGASVFVDAGATGDGLGSVAMDNEDELRGYLWKSLKPGASSGKLERGLALAELMGCAALMFGSCAWFWEDISRPETVQALRFAARAMDLARELTGRNLEQEFEARLQGARPNDTHYATGAELYRRLARATVRD